MLPFVRIKKGVGVKWQFGLISKRKGGKASGFFLAASFFRITLTFPIYYFSLLQGHRYQ
jgi:hypothetical protein